MGFCLFRGRGGVETSAAPVQAGRARGRCFRPDSTLGSLHFDASRLFPPASVAYNRYYDMA
jgi:hypothetical protein